MCFREDQSRRPLQSRRASIHTLPSAARPPRFVQRVLQTCHAFKCTNGGLGHIQGHDTVMSVVARPDPGGNRTPPCYPSEALVHQERTGMLCAGHSVVSGQKVADVQSDQRSIVPAQLIISRREGVHKLADDSCASPVSMAVHRSSTPGACLILCVTLTYETKLTEFCWFAVPALCQPGHL